MPSKILLVIPCYHERDRLPRLLPRLCETLTRSALPVEVLAVDDGSGPEHGKWLSLYCEDLRRRYPLLRSALINSTNQGKGFAVYSGWREATGQTWLGFVDADGAVSAEEVARVLRLAVVEQPACEAVFTVRTGDEGTTVRRTWQRSLSGKTFRRLVRKLFHFPLPDTQCGFKLVRREMFQKIAPTLQEARYCFDIELTFRILQEGGQILPLPINWEESPGSRMGARSVFAMAVSLLRLKRRLGDWTKR
jgi:glycosyltransferase involved in cell wall biosynthesis